MIRALLFFYACFYLLFEKCIGNTGGTSEGNCDWFEGSWSKKNVWHPKDCSYEKHFTQLKDNYHIQMKSNDTFKMLFFGDSNVLRLISDATRALNGICINKGDYRNICLTKHLKIVSFVVFSVFPSDSKEVIDCSQKTKKRKEPYYATNLAIMENAINEFIENHKEKPELLEFSINFEEIIHLKQEMHCSTNSSIRSVAEKQFQRGSFDTHFLDEWSASFERDIIILKDKAKEFHAFPFTKTFHIPNEKKSLQSIGPIKFIKQLNSRIREISKKLEVHVLDLDRMTQAFRKPEDYLHQDGIHFKPFISEEIMNILMNWLLKRRKHHHFHSFSNST